MNWPYRGFTANALWCVAWAVTNAFWYTTQGLGWFAGLWRGNDERR